jgi:hypothetical protein
VAQSNDSPAVARCSRLSSSAAMPPTHREKSCRYGPVQLAPGLVWLHHRTIRPTQPL